MQVTTELQLKAASVSIGQSGQLGTIAAFPVDDNKIVTVTDMKVGTYTIAAQPSAPSLLSVGVTAVDATDTMGTVTFVGTAYDGSALTEIVVPVADSTVYTTAAFASVTSITGAGWVTAGGADQIIIGVADAVAPTGFYFSAMHIVTATVVASQTNKTGSITADLTSFTSIPVGVYPIKLTKISLTSGEAILTMAQA